MFERHPVSLGVRCVLVGALLCLAHIGGVAQEPTEVFDPNLDPKGDSYMNRQSEALLSEVEKSIEALPPRYPEPRERHLALLLMDGVLHDPYAAFRPPVQTFFHRRMGKVLSELENTPVEQGARIWKLYNMAFIVRTPTVTLAFNLVRGNSSKSEAFALDDVTMERFVEECDVLFISHRHRDHVDRGVAESFLDQGKPVVAPPQVWKEDPIWNRITHLEREAHTLQSLPLGNDKPTLEVVIYPGHQMSEVENNVSLVKTPEGLSFVQLGDQINEGDFMIDYEWIDRVGEFHAVDVMMPPCWTNEIHRIVKGFKPRLVLPGHENELGHPVDDRVPYWGDSEFLNLTYPELKQSDYPVVVMTWGESIPYPLVAGQ